MRRFTIAVAVACSLSGCATALKLADGDRLNALAINRAAGDATGVRCAQELAPVTMASPDPAADGLLTLAARKLALQAAARDACGGILATEALGRFGL